MGLIGPSHHDFGAGDASLLYFYLNTTFTSKFFVVEYFSASFFFSSMYWRCVVLWPLSPKTVNVIICPLTPMEDIFGLGAPKANDMQMMKQMLEIVLNINQ